MKDLSGIVAKFKVQGTVEEIKPLGTGLINDTYKVNTKEVDAPRLCPATHQSCYLSECRNASSKYILRYRTYTQKTDRSRRSGY